jgi:hypothetical protein
MITAELEELEVTETEEERVLRWRLEQLDRAGYDAGTALLVASQHDVDLHAATDLVRRGCPPATALRILL